MLPKGSLIFIYHLLQASCDFAQEMEKSPCTNSEGCSEEDEGLTFVQRTSVQERAMAKDAKVKEKGSNEAQVLNRSLENQQGHVAFVGPEQGALQGEEEFVWDENVDEPVHLEIGRHKASKEKVGWWIFSRRRDPRRRRSPPPGWPGNCFEAVRRRADSRRRSWNHYEGMALHIWENRNCGGDRWIGYSHPPIWPHFSRYGCRKESRCTDDGLAWGNFKEPTNYPPGNNCGEHFWENPNMGTYRERGDHRRRMAGRVSSWVIILDWTNETVRDQEWCVTFWTADYFKGAAKEFCCGANNQMVSSTPGACVFADAGHFNFDNKARSLRMYMKHRRRAEGKEIEVAGNAIPRNLYSSRNAHAAACGQTGKCMKEIADKVGEKMEDTAGDFVKCLTEFGLSTANPFLGTILTIKGMAENCLDCRMDFKAFSDGTKKCTKAIIDTALGSVPAFGPVYSGAQCFLDLFAGGLCVAQDTLLNVNGVKKTLGELQPGDSVETLTSDIEETFMPGPYERRNGTFLGWAAKYENVQQEMVKVDVGQRSIVLTDKHYLLSEGGQLTPADELLVGQRIVVHSAQGAMPENITKVTVLPANETVSVAMPLVVMGLTEGKPEPGDLMLTASGIALPLYNQQFYDLSPSQSRALFKTWLRHWKSVGESETKCLTHMDHAHHASLIVELIKSYTSRHHAGILSEDELDVDKFLCYVVTHKKDEFKFEDLDHIAECKMLITKFKGCKSDDWLVNELDESTSAVHNHLLEPQEVVGEDMWRSDPNLKTKAGVCNMDGEQLLPGDASNSTFRCSSGDCVAIEARCNGFANCVDGSDEINC